MKVELDVVIAHCQLSLDELNQLNKGKMVKIEDFIQSQVMLKSGNELVATGQLFKVDDQYAVAVDFVNEVKG
ncbi:FliM/FliN family flagellar motor C-terminal domain-containing protein [Vibrio parahaemolyticus]|uniref:FliM/FliN family flagellar motor C-terminal domain-containing protein n=1 Tax=Vibrio parahaemolyticus TaxID=670 RepID=UPI00038E2C76|nr:FliM/FliN family flagellar motor C-terminal domain-containing protein [Vibrio parahaemolyticus]USN27327.1 type III secretion system-2 VscQ2 [synthetic construct]AYF22596.1 Type III secretion system-2 VscQ2 [Vibrio parahaemolyticus]EGR1122286.1 FliM/FliN family flagellar motor switch protein [Vibrio parahaemolyticus]EJG1712288.1 FliM/FliN family flagellar motor switch protein [Vibrio parahaemolyticus]EJG1730802.1 FliM/FliN family flagellar motor switch protein [Vibrio parahaemolyticus]